MVSFLVNTEFVLTPNYISFEKTNKHHPTRFFIESGLFCLFLSEEK